MNWVLAYLLRGFGMRHQMHLAAAISSKVTGRVGSETHITTCMQQLAQRDI
jgi:hypothetical protein